MKKIFLLLTLLTTPFFIKTSDFIPTKENCTDAFISMMQALHGQEIIKTTQQNINNEIQAIRQELEQEKKQENNKLFEWYLKGRSLGISEGNMPALLRLNTVRDDQQAKYFFALYYLEKCIKQNMLLNNFIPRAKEELEKENNKNKRK